MTRDLEADGALEYRLFLSRFLKFVEQEQRRGTLFRDTEDKCELTQRRRTPMGFQRDNVLTLDERNASARKCLRLLEDCTERLTERELGFVEDMPEKIQRWGCTEPQLQRLRDLVSKYVT